MIEIKDSTGCKYFVTLRENLSQHAIDAGTAVIITDRYGKHTACFTIDNVAEIVKAAGLELVTK